MGGSTGDVAERDLLVLDDGLAGNPPVAVDGNFRASTLKLDPARGAIARGAAGSGSERPATLPAIAFRETRSAAATIRAAFAVEIARGAAFNFIPIFMGAGALLYFFAASEPSFAYLLAATVIGAIFALAGRRWLYPQLIAGALCCLALGATFAKMETWRAATEVIGGDITSRVTGRLLMTDLLANGRTRIVMDVLSTERPKLRYAPSRIRISTRALPDGIRAGDVLTGPARLIPPLGPVRPGSYDFSFYSYFNGIGASGYFLGAPQRVEQAAPPGWRTRLLVWVENTRDAIADRIRSRIPGAEGEIAAALIAGVEAGIPDDVNEDLRRTGLAHVLSISGLHMALVAATIIGALRLALALSPRFASRRPVRKYAAAVALLCLAIYLLISGYQVAAQRSFIMIAIMLLAVLFDRQALTMRNLALSAIIVLALSPHEVVGPSFQMSFAATAALIGAYGGWTRRRPNPPRHESSLAARIMRKSASHVGGLVATSLLAGAATTIFSAYHFQRVSPLSLFANLAAMPFVSVLVMPFAVLSVVLMPIGLDGPPLAVMGEGLRIMDGIAAWFSERSPLDAIGLVSPAAVISLTIALALATLLSTWLRAAAIPFALAGLAFCLLPPQPLAFVAENGHAVAVRTADGALALNRARQDDFSVTNWKRAIPTDAVLKPRRLGNDDDMPWDVAMDMEDGRFSCNEIACAALDGGQLIVTTQYAHIASIVCDFADLIVLDDAAAGNPCAGHAATLLTRRELARGGSAEITLVAASSPGSGAVAAANAATAQAPATSADSLSLDIATSGKIIVTYAVATPFRPWHRHRQFSREARGLPPWKPDPNRRKRAKKLDASDPAPTSATTPADDTSRE